MFFLDFLDLRCILLLEGLLRWVQLDLGSARTVTEVRLYAPNAGLQVHLSLLPWPTQGDKTMWLAFRPIFGSFKVRAHCGRL